MLGRGCCVRTKLCLPPMATSIDRGPPRCHALQAGNATACPGHKSPWAGPGRHLRGPVPAWRTCSASPWPPSSAATYKVKPHNSEGWRQRTRTRSSTSHCSGRRAGGTAKDKGTKGTASYCGRAGLSANVSRDGDWKCYSREGWRWAPASWRKLAHPLWRLAGGEVRDQAGLVLLHHVDPARIPQNLIQW